ncbi:26S proteasome SU B6 [Baffinella frigidus]|nr:26S proteasome SU B6 [Cryptophyta sp. CCMP2293]|mmetsp:Transcript_14309/g.34629  ORF Transcript_14309/g.34629 Transcript_14309/m.34629 type:complete len:246 (+) Transcript_14309:977-1714(+)
MILPLKTIPFSEKYWENSLKKNHDIDKNQVFKIFKKNRSKFSPYQNNSGTIIAMADLNYCIIACDTRFTNGFTIPSKEMTRIIKISDKILLGSSGMFSDIQFLQEKIQKGVEKFKKENNQHFSLSGCAHFLSSILYSRRFFPFFTFNILAGLEEEKKGHCFSFDAIGSFEKNKFCSAGKGQSVADVILDSKMTSSNIPFLIESLIFLKKLFVSISYRGVTTGDGLQIFVLTKKGILIENSILKQD